MNKRTGEASGTFYLKKGDGSVYGPVRLAALKEWAGEGRVSPDDMISSDRDSWKPAPDLRELEMCWIVPFDEGDELGPVHIDVIKDLVEQGFVADGAEIRNSVSGESLILEAETGEIRPISSPKDMIVGRTEPLAEKDVVGAAETGPISGVISEAAVPPAPKPQSTEVEMAAAKAQIEAAAELRIEQLRREKMALKTEVATLRKRVAELERSQVVPTAARPAGAGATSSKQLTTVVRAAAHRLKAQAEVIKRSAPTNLPPQSIYGNRKGISSDNIRRGPLR